MSGRLARCLVVCWIWVKAPSPSNSRMSPSFHYCWVWSNKSDTVRSWCTVVCICWMAQLGNHGWLSACMVVPSPMCHLTLSFSIGFNFWMTFHSLLVCRIVVTPQKPFFKKYLLHIICIHILSWFEVYCHTSFSSRASLKSWISRIARPPSSSDAHTLCHAINNRYLSFPNFPIETSS